MRRPSVSLVLSWALVFGSLLTASGCGGGGGGANSQSGGGSSKVELGAHYYVWFPRNLQQGYLREKLVPKQEFLIGNYASTDPRAAEAHIGLAREAGIDFFTLDWWPTNRTRQEAIDKGFLAAKNIHEIKFCMFYESGDLGFDTASASVPFTDSVRRRFVEDLRYLARRYFSHPSYYRIDGKPVLVLYITRTFTGAFKEAIEEARAAMKAEGFEVFLVGDEIFWGVTRADGRLEASITDEPQTTRIKLFDAITAYNFYHSPLGSHGGYGANSTFINDVNGLLQRYRSAAGGVPVFPSVIPGYNDRGVRLVNDHYIIPRQWEQGGGEGSFLSQMISRVLVPNLDSRYPVGFVTSWNEWNEDTAVEPLAVNGATSTDSSDSGSTYTGGFQYAGHGTTYLERIKESLE